MTAEKLKELDERDFRHTILRCNTYRVRSIICSLQNGETFTHDGIKYSPIFEYTESGRKVREPRSGDLILTGKNLGLKLFHIKGVHPKRWVIPEDENVYKYDTCDCVPVTQDLVDFNAFIKAHPPKPLDYYRKK